MTPEEHEARVMEREWIKIYVAIGADTIFDKKAGPTICHYVHHEICNAFHMTRPGWLPLNDSVPYSYSRSRIGRKNTITLSWKEQP